MTEQNIFTIWKNDLKYQHLQGKSYVRKNGKGAMYALLKMMAFMFKCSLLFFVKLRQTALGHPLNQIA